MKTGMLWFDNNPRTDLMTKVSEAVVYYTGKYGRKPDLCFVHPSMLGENPPRSNSIEVRPNRQVLPNHLWLGILEPDRGTAQAQ